MISGNSVLPSENIIVCFMLMGLGIILSDEDNIDSEMGWDENPHHNEDAILPCSFLAGEMVPWRHHEELRNVS